jgi:hypothetical protein
MLDPVKPGPLALALIGVWRLRRYFDVTAGMPDFHPFGIHPEGLLRRVRFRFAHGSGSSEAQR